MTAAEQELREPEGKNIFIECEEECHNGFRNLMYKVLQKFQVGSKCCVSLEGDVMLHWIDGGVKIKLDEVNAYLWQKRVDLNLKYTLDDIWNILNTHPAYRHLKE